MPASGVISFLAGLLREKVYSRNFVVTGGKMEKEVKRAGEGDWEVPRKCHFQFSVSLGPGWPEHRCNKWSSSSSRASSSRGAQPHHQSGASDNPEPIQDTSKKGDPARWSFGIYTALESLRKRFLPLFLRGIKQQPCDLAPKAGPSTPPCDPSQVPSRHRDTAV
ncbi:putative uncharacterized protein C7orf71 homolog [Sus scrofa]|uniref:putative uncharacterized protein C7orf71 homolog n=1 Tax=Sus scrofa TaxID=9823 RepID=UPI000A2B7058|nr:putative uncharacterized protein C7orf71 homolog [Sus scrofa]